MRSSFNILWVDDQQHNVNSQMENIRIKIFKEGFELKTIFAKNSIEAEKHIYDDIYGDNIDLILMDYDLGKAELEGHKVLTKIRKKYKFKEVLFYSGSSTAKLNEIISSEKLDGIFCCHRRYLSTKVMQIFEVLIKKTLDLNHSRGIILGMSCEIDQLIKEALSYEFDTNLTSKEIILNGIHKEKSDNLKHSSKGMEVCINPVPSIFDSFYQNSFIRSLLSSFKMAKFLKKVLIKTESVDFLNNIKLYIDESIPIRNDFAHISIENKAGFVTVFKDRYGMEITKEQLKNIRFKFLQHIKIMEKLRNQQKKTL